MSNDKCNFLAWAITPWHVHGVHAALEFFKRQGIKTTGYIYIQDHHETGKVVSKELINGLDDEIEVKDEAEYKGHQNNIIQNTILIIKKLLTMKKAETEDTVYVVIPHRPKYSLLGELKNSRIIYVIVDEGIGTYIIPEKQWIKESCRVSCKANGEGKIIYWLKLLQENYLWKWYDKILKKKGCYIDLRFFVKNNVNQYVPNKLALDIYKSVMHIDAKSDEEYTYNFSKYVILNPPLNAANNYSDEQDIQVIKKCVEICKDNGIEVIVKPHPRERNLERYGSMGCIIEKRINISQEEIVSSSKIKPICVIGFTSTTLITLKYLFDVNTISICGLLDADKLSDTEKNKIMLFNNAFSQLVERPCDYNEMEEMIKSY